jgi:hypothetical protein
MPTFPAFPEISKEEVAKAPDVVQRLAGWGWEVQGWKKKMEARCP